MTPPDEPDGGAYLLYVLPILCGDRPADIVQQTFPGQPGNFADFTMLAANWDR